MLCASARPALDPASASPAAHLPCGPAEEGPVGANTDPGVFLPYERDIDRCGNIDWEKRVYQVANTW